MSYKVFPGANTSRFEHSIGVYSILKMLLDHLIHKQPELLESCDARKQELICIAGLIHDLGHGPFSHLFDVFLKKSRINNSWDDHENRSIDLFRDLINEYKIPIEEDEISFIELMIKGTGDTQIWYHHVVNNKIAGLDMDKIDYVLRDSMNFGMKIHFDPLRLIKSSRVIDGELCFCDRIRDEIVTIFLIRNKMNRFIYRHPKVCEYENTILHFLGTDNFKEIITQMKKKNIKYFIRLQDATILLKIPIEEWYPFECRKKKLEDQKDSFKKYKDKEWIKIKNLKFYRKKYPQEKFILEDWTIVSCF
jgi:HD superfamily phosphohydrolase